MNLTRESYYILTPISNGGVEELQMIEQAARTCYKSEDKIDDTGKSAEELILKLMERGHEAMLEFSNLTVRFVVDRGVSHELVRHRLASFAQESTRYCNYTNEKFGHSLTFVIPRFFDEKGREKEYGYWEEAMLRAEDLYLKLIEAGATPQEARTVLPNSLKTEIVISTNYREWRNILKLRTAGAAHPQMRLIMRRLLHDLQNKIPIIFDDIIY